MNFDGWTAAKCGAFFEERGWRWCDGVAVEDEYEVKCRAVRDGDLVDVKVEFHKSEEDSRSYETLVGERDGFLRRRCGLARVEIVQTSRVDAERLRDAYVALGRFDVESLSQCFEDDGWTVLAPPERYPQSREAIKQRAEGRSYASLELDTEAEDSYDEDAYTIGVACSRRGSKGIRVIALDVDAAAWWFKELERERS